MVTATQTEIDILVELEKCALSKAYFINRYCRIHDPSAGNWIPFRLWPAQRRILQAWDKHQFNIDLKARQVGLTWLALAFGLHGMIFNPIFEFLVFSRREVDAFYLTSNERLRGMYFRLPEWMQAQRVVVDDKSHLRLSNGSGVRAFPSNAGDSYTANLALIDEADLVPDLGGLLGSVKPTIDAGGNLLLISRADKSKPQSRFKKIYLAAKAGENEWHPGFIAWYEHPGRTQEWYEAQARDVMKNTGVLDDLYEQYPETDMEAVAPKTLDKRFSPMWLKNCYQELEPIGELPEDAPSIPGLMVYQLPLEGHRYVGGVDPAEGNPTSDDSAFVVLDADSGEEVAILSGKFDPSVMASHADTVMKWFNRGGLLVERNNHGHAVLLWLNEYGGVPVLQGFDGKDGWLSNSRGKTLMYDGMADALRNADIVIHSPKLYEQLMSIEGATLRAPDGEMDDCSDAGTLANAGRSIIPVSFVETW